MTECACMYDFWIGLAVGIVGVFYGYLIGNWLRGI